MKKVLFFTTLLGILFAASSCACHQQTSSSSMSIVKQSKWNKLCFYENKNKIFQKGLHIWNHTYFAKGLIKTLLKTKHSGLGNNYQRIFIISFG